MLKKMIALLALAAAPGLFAGAIVYDNTINNPVNAIVFSAGGYTQIGDQISLAGTERLGESATVQLFNLGDAGQVRLNLGLYSASLPAGSPFASFSTLLNAPLASAFDVTFNLGGLTLPDSLIFAISWENLDLVADLAVLTSDGPFVGSSDNTFYVNNIGSGLFADGSADNVAMKLSANSPVISGSIPEPATFILLGFGIAAIGLGRKYLG